MNFNTPVRGNNTTGYAAECYEGYNSVEKSEYSLTQTITLPAGHYTLVNYSFFREGEKYDTDASTSRAYLKAGDNQVLVKTLGSITASGYANSQAEGANCFDSKMYRNTLDFTIDADNTQIEIGVYGTFNTNITKSWMILGMFELIDNDQAATMDSPFDVTGYITNPGFEYRDMSGWTQSPSDFFGTQGNNQSFKVGGYYAEKWQASGALPDGNFSQTLTNLPAGYYKLTANLGGNGTYVTMNSKTANWTEDKDYTVGYVLAENEALTITAGKTAEGTANWIHFDNFRLQYCGDVQAALTTLLGQVSSYEGQLPVSIYSTLQNNVSTYNKSYSDVDALLAAIAGVQALYDAADATAAAYATLKSGIDDYAAKAVALDAAGSAAYAANENVTAVNTAYTNGTYSDAEAVAAVSTLQTAYIAAVKAQTAVGSNWTDVITNPSFESDISNGWTNSGMGRQDNTSFGKTGTYYAEKWEPVGSNGVTQTINSMPAGVYRLSAHAKARNVTSARLYAAGINQAITIADSEADYSVEFACDANANVTIGFEGVGTDPKTESSWLCVDNFTLTLVSAGLPDVIAVTGKMNADVEQAQTDAISTYNANKTVSNYNAASAAIAAAQSSKDAYTAANAALTKANSVLSGTNLYTTAAYNTFKGIVDTAQDRYDNGTLTTDDANALNSTLFGTVWHSTAAVDDFLISAWDVNARDWSTYHVNTWSTTDDSGNPNFFAPCIEYWVSEANTLADKTMTATLTGFTPGATYKVSAKVCVGVNTDDDASTAPTGITLQLNDGGGVSVCTGGRIESTRFYEGDFEATGIIGVDGKLNVKFNVSNTNASWMTFRNVSYVKTADADAPTADELAALANAIDAVKDNVAGFQKDEYAPYNNIDAFAALANAQAANLESKLSVTTATTALTSATWTANSEEVNAFYDGTFAIQPEHTTGPTALAGWNTPEGIRQLIKNTDTDPGLNSATDKAAVFAWGSTTLTYGNTEGYTMPLAAHTIYELTFKTCGWRDGDMGYVNVTVLNDNNEGMTQQTSATATKRIGDENPWNEFKIVFATGDAGNYKFGMWTSKHTVFTDLVLKKAASQVLEFADGSVPAYAPGTYPSVKITRTLTAKRWATAVYPFALSTDDVNNIAVLDSYDASSGELNFSSATSSAANVPFLMRSTAGSTEINLSNVVVAATAAEPKATASEVSLKGTYSLIEIDNTAKNYVLSNNVIYEVGSAKATITPYRAYFQVDQSVAPEARLQSFAVDGEATAIEGIAMGKKIGNGDVYNLKGQKMNGKLGKDIYVIDGKKAVVK